MADSIYRLQVGYVCSNKNFCLNTFHYRFDDSAYTTSWDAADDLCTNWRAFMIPDFVKLLGLETIVNLVSARRIKISLPPNAQDGGISASQIVSSPAGAAVNTFSAAIAGVISWVNADPDARLGRTFLGAVPENAMAADIFQAPYTTDAATFISDMLNPLTLLHGSANFGKYDRKTHTFWVAQSGFLNPKPAGFTKRTLPVT